ncbi:MAG: polyprenyl synthetase family protein [Gemmatimonadota bacterium]
MTPSGGDGLFETFLGEERARVDRALGSAVERLLPVLPAVLRAPIRQGVLVGGKRVRPILCVAAYRACREGGLRNDPEPDDAGIHALAISVELIHAYSLMHDDLPCMDDAPLRRGRPTPHTLFGEGPTMVAGVALIPAAALHAWEAAERLGIDIERRREIVRVLCDAAGSAGMVGGQGLDLLGEGRRLVRTELDELHGMKTGALLTAALVIGGIAAEAPPGVGAALERYGRAIGLAFQVADDVLDATASAETLGKQPSDMELEKSTYVSLLGVTAARAEADRQTRRARSALEDAGIRSAALQGLADYVVYRDR